MVYRATLVSYPSEGRAKVKNQSENIDDSSRKNQTTGTLLKNYMIEIERPGEKLDMPDVKAVLEGTGIELDPNYGPYCVDPKLGRHVVRGTATAKAEENARKLTGVKLYSDPKIQPAKRNV